MDAFEWAEATCVAGTKIDILRHAYNFGLCLVALPVGGAVVITRYESTHTNEPTERFIVEEVKESAVDELVLHAEHRENKVDGNTFRHISWSKQRSSKNFLSIASNYCLEIWAVEINNNSIMASCIHVERINRVRSLEWNPIFEQLLVAIGDREPMLFDLVVDSIVSVKTLVVGRPSSINGSTWSWGLRGQHIVCVTNRTVYFYTMVSTELLLVDSWSLDVSRDNTIINMDVSNSTSVGSFRSVRFLSDDMVILTTEVPITLNKNEREVFLTDDKLKEHKSNTVMSDTSLVSTISTDANSVIDLTSLRQTASSSQPSLLRILEHDLSPSPIPIMKNTNLAGGESHTAYAFLLVQNSQDNKWHYRGRIPLPQLTCPDIVDVLEKYVIVGSTMSNKLIVAQVVNDMKSSSLLRHTGELALPMGHVCRGLRFISYTCVQAASSKKAKYSGFFNVSDGIQRIHLSRLKIPKHITLQESTISLISQVVNDEPSSESQSIDAAVSNLLTRMEHMQSALFARFDQVDARLNVLFERLDRMESP